jgi:rhodanese-related sulfurtransferase
VAGLLMAKGYSKVYALKGGWQEWDCQVSMEKK